VIPCIAARNRRLKIVYTRRGLLAHAERPWVRGPSNRAAKEAAGGAGKIREVSGEAEVASGEVGRFEEFHLTDGAEKLERAEGAGDLSRVLPEGGAGGRALVVGGGVKADSIGGKSGRNGEHLVRWQAKGLALLGGSGVALAVPFVGDVEDLVGAADGVAAEAVVFDEDSEAVARDAAVQEGRDVVDAGTRAVLCAEDFQAGWSRYNRCGRATGAIDTTAAHSAIATAGAEAADTDIFAVLPFALLKESAELVVKAESFDLAGKWIATQAVGANDETQTGGLGLGSGRRGYVDKITINAVVSGDDLKVALRAQGAGK